MYRQKTIRIFVSSTFKDLRAERNALHEKVFSRLRDMCVKKGWRFQAIDLRWGVSDEAGLDQRTMQICLDEIERCRQTSPKPYFIILLGDRYGWCPLPEKIPGHEFEQIRDLLLQDADQRALELLEWRENQTEKNMGWYRRDNNALYHRKGYDEPQLGVYTLQPRLNGSRYEKFNVWHDEVEEPLGQVFCKATKRLGFSETDSLKYGASSTEQEIHAGCLSIPDAREHIFAFFRELNSPESKCLRDTKEMDEIMGTIFDTDSHCNRDFEAQGLLDALKKRICSSIGEDNIFRYPAKLTRKGLSLDHIEHLCEDVYLNLEKVILQQMDLFEKLSPLELEIQHHNDFQKERTRFFIGRTKALRQITEHLHSDNRSPLVVYGPSGSGKSALMAMAAKLASRNNSHCLARFIGATPNSSNIRSLLEMICRDIGNCYGVDTSEIGLEYKDLCKEFSKFLSFANPQCPMFIFIDAIDLLGEADNARNLNWLPRELPEHVHIIISLTDKEYKQSPAETMKHQLFLEPMQKNEGIELLDLWLSNAKRTLTKSQHAMIINKFLKSHLPLYLKLAFEEARLWRSYDDSPNLGSDITTILHNLFDRLSDLANHGPLLVGRTLNYIRCSRHGLNEEEILAILALDEPFWNHFLCHTKHDLPRTVHLSHSKVKHQIPIVILLRLLYDLEPYMTERIVDDTSLLCFYHHQFNEEVDNYNWSLPPPISKFSDLEEDVGYTHWAKSDYHRTIAQYFCCIGDPELNSEWKGHSVRAISEFPYHIARCENMIQAFEALLAPGFMQSKALIHRREDLDKGFLFNQFVSDGIYELIEDFKDFIQISNKDKNLEKVANYRDLANFTLRILMLNSQILSSEPSMLSQIIFNELLNKSWPSYEKLRIDLVNYLHTKTWLQTTTVKKSERKTLHFSTPNGNSAIAAELLKDKLFLLLENGYRLLFPDTGKLILDEPRCFSDDKPLSMDISPCHKFAAIMLKTGKCILLRLESGETLVEWQTRDKPSDTSLHKGAVKFSRDSRYLITWSMDCFGGPLAVWKIEPHGLIYNSKYSTFTPLLGYADEISKYHCSQLQTPHCAGFLDNSDSIFICTTVEFKAWNIKTEEVYWHITKSILRRGKYSLSFDDAFTAAVSSNSGRLIAVACENSGVHLWDTSQKQNIKNWNPQHNVEDITISNDDRIVATADTSHVHIWNIDDMNKIDQIFRPDPYHHAFAIKSTPPQLFLADQRNCSIYELGISGFSNTSKMTLPNKFKASAINSDFSKVVYALSKELQIFDLFSGEQICSLEQKPATNRFVSWNKNGEFIISCDSNGECVVCSAVDLKVIGHTIIRQTEFCCMAVTKNGDTIILGTENGECHSWQWRINSIQLLLSDLTGPVNSLAVSTDGTLLALSLLGNEHGCLLWNLDNSDVERILIGHTLSINSICFSNENAKLVTCSADRTTRIWDLLSEKNKPIIINNNTEVLIARFLEKSSVVTCDDSGWCRIFDSDNGRFLCSHYVDYNVSDLQTDYPRLALLNNTGNYEEFILNMAKK